MRTARRVPSMARSWFALAGALSAVAGGACGGGAQGGDGGIIGPGISRDGPGGGGQRLTWSFDETLSRDIDILFMVDNSLSMAPLQQKLVASFPVFMQVLNGLPGGPLDLHLGVISSNMGAGANEIPQCPREGDRGILQSAPRGACTTANSGLMPGQRFASNVGGQANYTGSIDTVFGCMAPLGDQGCGFEAPLGSVVRALGADDFDAQGNPRPPPENAGFLRPDALLAIILVTNEDDCSVPSDSDLFNPGSRYVTDSYGPLSSFRCNEYGHLCDGTQPSRTKAATYGACVPNYDGTLVRVSETVERIKLLKRDPSRILVATIAGLPTPYAVELVAPMVRDDPNMWPAVQHSCFQALTPAAEYADPGVRLAAFVQAFGPNGVYQSICADSFAPALQRIAEAVGASRLAPACVEGSIMLRDGQPDCTVTERYAPGANPASRTIPICEAASGQQPCWRLVAGSAEVCSGKRRLVVERADAPPAVATLELSCARCTTGRLDDCI